MMLLRQCTHLTEQTNTMNRNVYLYGAGGHAKVIIDIMHDNGYNVVAVIDDNKDINEVCGVPVIHDMKKEYNPFIVSIGYNSVRYRIANAIDKAFAKGIHSSAVVSPSAIVGEGTVIMQGAILQAEACIGKHCIVNTGASVGHECIVDNFVHIAPHSTLCGNVHVGEGTWVGAGATVIPGVKIGKWCVIGAGSVVIKDVEDGAVVVGCPAKTIKHNDMLSKVNRGGVTR